MYFLEQLVAEWFEYRGYFVRTNIKFGKLGHGGWTGEIDVAAYHPQTREFVHVEASMDSETWPKRKIKFEKKFRGAQSYYEHLFPFPKASNRKVAVVGFTKPKEKSPLGAGIELVLVPEFVRMICEELRSKDPLKQAIPESMPLLRSMQYAVRYGGK